MRPGCRPYEPLACSPLLHESWPDARPARLGVLLTDARGEMV
jgi:hypothetical protein